MSIWETKTLSPVQCKVSEKYPINHEEILMCLAELYNPIWSFAIGDCHLDRRTDQYLIDAGDWASIELKTDMEESKWSLFPRTWGFLVKPGAIQH